MFIGHFAVGFAAKRVAPSTPLGWLVLAPIFLDVLWPVFVLTGIEHAAIVPGITAFVPLDLYDMPWSHSLAMAIVWSAVLALAYRMRHTDRRGAIVIAAGVFSHWVLDWVTHRPDMGIAPGIEHRVGLALWNSIPGSMITELAIVAASIASYVRATRPIDRAGRWGLVAIVAFLLVAYLATAFGPLPPSMRAVTIGSLVATAIVVGSAAWIEHHRAPR
jgi:membrane-bound metal-dependent hydrolase YbcI (DUF457 family)